VQHGNTCAELAIEPPSVLFTAPDAPYGDA